MLHDAPRRDSYDADRRTTKFSRSIFRAVKALSPRSPVFFQTTSYRSH